MSKRVSCFCFLKSGFYSNKFPKLLSSISHSSELQSMRMIYRFEALDELFHFIYDWLTNLQDWVINWRMGVKCNFVTVCFTLRRWAIFLQRQNGFVPTFTWLSLCHTPSPTVTCSTHWLSNVTIFSAYKLLRSGKKNVSQEQTKIPETSVASIPVFSLFLHQLFIILESICELDCYTYSRRELSSL